MTEEVQQNLAEVDSAPASEVTATPETVETAPVVADEPSRVFTQEELDAAIGKRLAREQRKWERDQAARQPVIAPASVPTPEQFNSPQDYSNYIRQEAVNLVQEQEAQRQQSEILELYHDKEEEARVKYDDFEQVAYNPKLTITDVMAQSIQASDIGPDVIYYLGANPKEANRISRLAPILQAKEIGRIEAKLANDPPTKKTTSAPAPISPVTARSSGSSTYDTTDPRSTKAMTDSQWIEAERARQMKKWEAQRIR